MEIVNARAVFMAIIFFSGCVGLSALFVSTYLDLRKEREINEIQERIIETTEQERDLYREVSEKQAVVINALEADSTLAFRTAVGAMSKQDILKMMGVAE